MCELVSRRGSLSEVLEQFRSRYFITGELNTPVADVPGEARRARGAVRPGGHGLAPRRPLGRGGRLALQRAPVEHGAAPAPEPRSALAGADGREARRGPRGHPPVGRGSGARGPLDHAPPRPAGTAIRRRFGRESHRARTLGSDGDRARARDRPAAAVHLRGLPARRLLRDRRPGRRLLRPLHAVLRPRPHRVPPAPRPPHARRDRLRDARRLRRLRRAGAVRRPARDLRPRRAHRADEHHLRPRRLPDRRRAATR